MNSKDYRRKSELNILKSQKKLNGNMVRRQKTTGVSVNMAIPSRRALAGRVQSTHNGKRNLYDVFGYRDVITPEEYRQRFQRQDIAKRIVAAYPEACWSSEPIITDNDDMQGDTTFDKSLKEIIEHPQLKIYHYIRRLDKVMSLGCFAVLFIGVRDGKKAQLPLDTKINIDDILFFAPYAESDITISKYDEDPQSRRYGLPVMYKLGTNGYDKNETGTVLKRAPLEVHYTRIIHVAEGLLDNDIVGTPRLEDVVNRLVDLEKIVGGSAETFYLNARGGMHFSMPGDSILQPDDKKALEENMQDFSHNLTRYLKTAGVDVNVLNFNIADPKNHFDVIISLISASTGIPKRILTGSEQGQLASSQDENNWIAKVRQRQKDFCELQILRPLIDWFILNGVLIAPENGRYKITWPDLKSVSDMDKAEVAVKKTQALNNYLNANGADMVMSPKQLFEDVLGLEYRPDDLPDNDDSDDLEDDEEE